MIVLLIKYSSQANFTLERNSTLCSLGQLLRTILQRKQLYLLATSPRLSTQPALDSSKHVCFAPRSFSWSASWSAGQQPAQGASGKSSSRALGGPIRVKSAGKCGKIMTCLLWDRVGNQKQPVWEEGKLWSSGETRMETVGTVSR